MNPIQRCSCCGRRYTAIAWSFLPLLGMQEYEWGEILEVRRCLCGSSRAVQIAAGDDEMESDIADIHRDPDLAADALIRRAS